MRVLRIIATSPQTAVEVAVQIMNGKLPDVYKTDEECVHAYVGQPMPMQVRYFPYRVTLTPKGDDGIMDAHLYRLDLPNEPPRYAN